MKPSHLLTMSLNHVNHLRSVFLATITIFHLGGNNAVLAQKAGARFLLLQPGAISNSMGGAGSAMHEDAFATYYNPAGLAYLPSVSMVGSFVKPIPVLEGVVHSYVAAAASLTSLGTFAVSGNFYDKGKHPVTSSAGPEIVGLSDPMDWQAKLSYARAFSEHLAGGVSLGLLGLELSDSGTEREHGAGTSTSLTFDAGIMYKELFTNWTLVDTSEVGLFPFNPAGSTRRGITLGLAFRNIGPSTVFIDADQPDNISSLATLGLTYSPYQSRILAVTLAAEIEKRLYEESTIDYAHWGLELVVDRFIALRGGYFQDTAGPKNSYWTWGVGLTFMGCSANLAHYQRTLQSTFHFDVSISMEL